MRSIRNPWAELSPINRRKAYTGLLFSLPWIISMLVLVIYPVFNTIYLSFTEYSVLEPPKWIGLANYEEIFTKDLNRQLGLDACEQFVKSILDRLSKIELHTRV